MPDKRWFTDHTRPDVWNRLAPGWVDKLQALPVCYGEKAIVQILEDVFEAGFETGSEDGERGLSHMEDVRERIRSTR
jgi:hypothetical protein